MNQPLWLAMEARLRKELDAFEIRVSKTQLSLYSGCMFACVSEPRSKKQKDGVILTFGLPLRVESDRIWQVTEPYPNRWTHHMLITSESQLDDELIHWLRAAQAFAQMKKR